MEDTLCTTVSPPLEAYARRVVPRQSLHDLEAQITELTGHLNAATYYWLTLVAEFDRREGWGGDGATRSCAHWLNWKCGIDLGAARERVRVAHALENLPRISAAMREGRLSYSKVRAITRVASEATEETFLQIAIHGTAHHVEKLVRAFRRAKEAEELSREAQQQERRGLMWLYDPDGSLVIRATLPAEAGAVFIKAMEAAVKSAPPTKTAAEKDVSAATSSRMLKVAGTESLAHRRADAFVRIAESFESVALEHSLPLADWRELLADNERRGLSIDQRTAITRWTGEAMDYQIAIDSLLFRERRAAKVAAETSDRTAP